MDAQTRQTLSGLLGAERLAVGEVTLRKLHERWVKLVRGELREGPGDDYYAHYFLYYLTPSLEAIADDGWVDRHLRDFVLLAQSPALEPCCRATVLELFGLEAFHVAVQFNSCADELVRHLCHSPGNRRDHAKQVARDVMHFSEADGTYPPPGMFHSGTRMYTATHSRVLDLGGWSSFRLY